MLLDIFPPVSFIVFASISMCELEEYLPNDFLSPVDDLSPPPPLKTVQLYEVPFPFADWSPI